MRIRWVFTGCDEDCKSAAINYFQNRKLELQGKLRQAGEDPADLRMAVHHQSESSEWEIQAALHSSGRTLTCESHSDELGAAWDDIFADFARQIEEGEAVAPPVAQQRHGRKAMAPLLEKNYQAGRSDAFMAFLQPLVRSLQHYVDQELAARRREQDAKPDMLTAIEVLDEMLILAWERFGKRPKDRTLDLWLIELAHEIMDRDDGRSAQQSLEERQPAPDKHARGTDDDNWVDIATYQQTMELSDFLPGEESPDYWDRLDVETRQAGMARLLSTLPRQQRQTLLLSAVGGFSAAEIADFHGRRATDIEADLREARAIVQRRLEEENLAEIEQAMELSGTRDSRKRRR